MKRYFALFFLAGTFFLLPRAATAQDSFAPQIVHCYSPSEDTVEDMYAADCHGTIISDDEAKRVQQARIARNLRAINAPAPPVDPSLRQFSSGTGFFITPEADLMTNHHVVDGCAALTVETATGETATAHVVTDDAEADLALVHADTKPPGVADFRAAVRYSNQPVTVIGFPNEGLVAIKPITVGGTLSGPVVDAGLHFQFHADVRPGNSGGPILDQQGLVVGIVFAKIDTVSIYQRTRRVVSGIGFGISNAAVLGFLKDWVKPAVITDAAAGSIAAASPASFVARIVCWKPGPGAAQTPNQASAAPGTPTIGSSAASRAGHE